MKETVFIAQELKWNEINIAVTDVKAQILVQGKAINREIIKPFV